MPRISMNITMQTESRGDHWACHVPELGFTVYGKKRADAEHEVNHALAALLGSFHGDLNSINRYLTRYQVVYSVDSDAASDIAEPAKGTRQVHVEVPTEA